MLLPLKTSLPQILLKFVVILHILNLTDGCLRRNVPSTSDASEDNGSGVALDITTEMPTHKLPCTEEEARKTSCLNKGKCFAIPSYDDYREIGCKCTIEWVGPRCELKFIDPAILEAHQRNIRTAHMAAGVTVFLLFFFVLILVGYVMFKFKRKSRLPENQKMSLKGIELSGRRVKNNRAHEQLLQTQPNNATNNNKDSIAVTRNAGEPLNTNGRSD